MARIRTIKPEFFTSEQIVELSPLARLLFIATWCEADKEGRMPWKPRTLKIRYFPADDCDIDALARELHASGLVVLYGDGLAFIPSFKRHQHINPRESESTLPDHATPRVDDASARVSDAQGGRKEGREGKEKNDATVTSLPPTAACAPEKELIDGAIDYLGEHGVAPKQARSVIGMLRKTLADDLVLAELLAAAQSASIADPVAWLRKAAQARAAKRPNQTNPWDGAI